MHRNVLAGMVIRATLTLGASVKLLFKKRLYVAASLLALDLRPFVYMACQNNASPCLSYNFLTVPMPQPLLIWSISYNLYVLLVIIDAV